MTGERMDRTGEPNGLPASVLAIGETLRTAKAEEVAPMPALFADAEVFAAERARIFARSWIVADHMSRLTEDGRYFVVDAGIRSLVLTRESAERLHALGNICLHAGYPVCEDEDGTGDRLHCPYHDWAYALDGRLVYPALSPERYPPSRLRLVPYPLTVCRGLILVGLSAEAPPPDMTSALPAWLAGGVVVARRRCPVERNWKYLHEILRSSLSAILGCPPSQPILSLGALGFVAAGADRAIVLRLMPKAPERTDVQLIRLAPAGGELADGLDGVADMLAAAPVPQLDCRFFEWYWSLIA